MSGNNTGITRQPLPGPTHKDSPLTIGDYFTAARQFLSENDFFHLRTGLETVFGTPALLKNIQRICINLVKHGAFYHPLKIEVCLTNQPACLFVLNGAVSGPGLALVENEYQLIKDLNSAFSKRYLPLVFGSDVKRTDKGKIGFFLGEWLADYREFHVTEDPGQRQTVIWASDGSCHYISQKAARAVYQEVSRILTYYYDIETFNQIFPWHHAAGDFILRKQGERMDVRLITVRGYAPLTELCDDEADKKTYILPALLFFFLNLTLRMRLDRLNGTGRVVMVEKKILPAVVTGFFQALDEKSLLYDYGDLKLIFIAFFQNFDLDQIIELMEKIVTSGHTDAKEMEVIKENIEMHGRFLGEIFKTF